MGHRRCTDACVRGGRREGRRGRARPRVLPPAPTGLTEDDIDGTHPAQRGRPCDLVPATSANLGPGLRRVRARAVAPRRPRRARPRPVVSPSRSRVRAPTTWARDERHLVSPASHSRHGFAALGVQPARGLRLGCQQPDPARPRSRLCPRRPSSGGSRWPVPSVEDGDTLMDDVAPLRPAERARGASRQRRRSGVRRLHHGVGRGISTPGVVSLRRPRRYVVPVACIPPDAVSTGARPRTAAGPGCRTLDAASQRRGGPRSWSPHCTSRPDPTHAGHRGPAPPGLPRGGVPRLDPLSSPSSVRRASPAVHQRCGPDRHGTASPRHGRRGRGRRR